MQSGVLYLRLLWLVYLQGVIDVLEGLTELILATEQADTKKKGIHIVRSLFELFVY